MKVTFEPTTAAGGNEPRDHLRAPSQTPVVRSCSLIPRIRASKIRIASAHVFTSSMVKAELNFLEKGSFAFSWAVPR
jgi:hypothetical protein